MACRIRTLCTRGVAAFVILGTLSAFTACDEGAMAVLQVLGNRPDYKATFSGNSINGANKCPTEDNKRYIATEVWEQANQGPEPYGTFTVIYSTPECQVTSFDIGGGFSPTTADEGNATHHYRLAHIIETTDEEGNKTTSIDSRSTPVSLCLGTCQ